MIHNTVANKKISQTDTVTEEKNVLFVQLSLFIPTPHPVLMRQYIIKYETVRKLSYILKVDTVV